VVPGRFLIEPLSATHNRSAFSCGAGGAGPLPLDPRRFPPSCPVAGIDPKQIARVPAE